MLRFHSLHSDQFVLTIAEANLGGMRQAGFIFGIRSNIFKMVVVVAEIVLCHLIGKLGVWQWFLFQAGINASLINRQWVGRRKHPNVRQHWRIVAAVAVAGW